MPEIEGSLSEDQLAALKQGDETVLADILGYRLALTGFDHGGIEPDDGVRLDIISRLTDAEYDQTHAHHVHSNLRSGPWCSDRVFACAVTCGIIGAQMLVPAIGDSTCVLVR